MGDKFRLDDKVAVVIGGAGGLGEACALELGRRGAKVIVASRNLDKLREVAEKIHSETGSETVPFQVDVTDEQSVKGLAEQITERFGTVDILVNTHGMKMLLIVGDEMQANKFTVTVEIEVLSLDVVPGLLEEVANTMANENRTGSLLKEDGDCAKWGTKSKRVDF